MSVTVQVTFVTPSLKVADGWSFVIEATPQLSPVAGIVNVMVAKQFPISVFLLISAEHVMAGSSVSLTVTFCVQVFTFPWISVTVHVTIVSPTEKTFEG